MFIQNKSDTLGNNILLPENDLKCSVIYRINAMIKSAFGMYGLLSTSFVGDDNVFSNE